MQSLYFPNPKSQDSSHLLWLYSPVCVGPGRNPEDRFSHNEAHITVDSKGSEFYRHVSMMALSWAVFAAILLNHMGKHEETYSYKIYFAEFSMPFRGTICDKFKTATRYW